MLQEAVAELRGQTVVADIDPELTLDVEHHIPDDYVSDVGLRLSFYKRFASAPDEESVHELGAELEDRFGKPPVPVLQLAAAMALKPALRALRVLGCDGTAQRVTLHFSHDAPIDPAELAKLVGKTRGYQLTPDGKLICRFDAPGGGSAIDRVREVVSLLMPLREPA
jgi:transcription-repair coupling factor (superfamily II helicase)